MARGRGQGDGNELGLRTAPAPDIMPDLRMDPLGWRQWWSQADIMERLQFEFPSDCSHLDLSYLDLTGIDLRDRNLSGANLSEANVDGVLMNGANLAGAQLHGLHGRALSDYDDSEWQQLTAYPAFRQAFSGPPAADLLYSVDDSSRIHNRLNEAALTNLRTSTPAGVNMEDVYYLRHGLLHREDGPAIVKRQRRGEQIMVEHFLERGHYPTDGVYEHYYNAKGVLTQIKIARGINSIPRDEATKPEDVLWGEKGGPIAGSVTEGGPDPDAAWRVPSQIKDGVVEVRNLQTGIDSMPNGAINIYFLRHQKGRADKLATVKYDQRGLLKAEQYLDSAKTETGQFLGADIPRKVSEVFYRDGKQSDIHFRADGSDAPKKERPGTPASKPVVIAMDAPKDDILDAVRKKIHHVQDMNGELVVHFADLVLKKLGANPTGVGGLGIEMPIPASPNVPIYTIESYNVTTGDFVLFSGDAFDGSKALSDKSIAHIKEKLSAISSDLKISDFGVKPRVPTRFDEWPQVAERSYAPKGSTIT